MVLRQPGGDVAVTSDDSTGAIFMEEQRVEVEVWPRRYAGLIDRA